LPEAAPSAGRIVLIDNGLSHRIGHHAHFAFGLADALRAEKRPYIVLADEAMEPPLATDPLAPRPVFSLRFYQFIAEGDPVERVWNDHEIGARRYAEDLERSGFEPFETDLLWIPTARAREIAGLASWLKKRGRRPRIMLGIHSLLRSVEPGTVSGLVHRMAGRAIAEAVGPDRVLAYTTNKPLAVLLTAAMGLPVHAAPLPHFYSQLQPDESLPEMPAGDGALVGCLGVQREDKRFLDLPAILSRAHALRPDLRFMVQVGADGLDPSFLALEADPRIRLVRGYLEDRAFCALVQACDLLLLPYRAERYVSRVSGPFVFGAVYGTPSVVPARTWMAERIAAGRAAGLVYDGDDGALVETLARGADDLVDLHKKAAKLKKSWRDWDGRALLEAALRWSAGRSLEELRRDASGA
jgi:hypothetical protein